MRELLKQSQSDPLAVEDQVATIYTGTNGYLDVFEIGQVKRFLIGLRTYLTKNKPTILRFAAIMFTMNLINHVGTTRCWRQRRKQMLED